MNQTEIASYPEVSVFILRCGTDDSIPITFKGDFQLWNAVVQLIDMFEIVYIGQVSMMPEGDKCAYNIPSLFFGDDTERFFFQMILVNMVTQK